MPGGKLDAMSAPEDFALAVADVFRVTGRGTVVTGRVESGSLRSGETVQVWDAGELVATATATVEMACGPRRDPALAGLLLRDVEAGLLAAGQTIRGPAATLTPPVKPRCR